MLRKRIQSAGGKKWNVCVEPSLTPATWRTVKLQEKKSLNENRTHDLSTLLGARHSSLDLFSGFLCKCSSWSQLWWSFSIIVITTAVQNIFPTRFISPRTGSSTNSLLTSSEMAQWHKLWSDAAHSHGHWFTSRSSLIFLGFLFISCYLMRWLFSYRVNVHWDDNQFHCFFFPISNRVFMVKKGVLVNAAWRE